MRVPRYVFKSEHKYKKARSYLDDGEQPFVRTGSALKPVRPVARKKRSDEVKESFGVNKPSKF